MIGDSFDSFNATQMWERSQTDPNTNWTKDEDDLLFQIAALSHEHNWEEITRWFKDKSAAQLEHRWYTKLNPFGELRRAWTHEEDELLKVLVGQLGVNRWTDVATRITGRSARQVRDRWMGLVNQMNEDRPFTPEEDELIIQQYLLNGPKWNMIVQLLNGRSENSVKNRWYTELEKLQRPVYPVVNRTAEAQTDSIDDWVTNHQSNIENDAPATPPFNLIAENDGWCWDLYDD